MLLCVVIPLLTAAQTESNWTSSFSSREILVETRGICTGTIGELPSFTVKPQRAGKQLVRFSAAFPPASMPAEMGLEISSNQGERFQAALRPLTYYPGSPSSVRRGLVTFVYDFPKPGEYKFDMVLASIAPSNPEDLSQQPAAENPYAQVIFNGTMLKVDASTLHIVLPTGAAWVANIRAPETASPGPIKVEWVERNDFYLWFRVFVPDEKWPRIIEIRADASGRIAAQVHLQNRVPDTWFAPDFGWEIIPPVSIPETTASFSDGKPVSIATDDGKYALDFPTAPFYRRGSVKTSSENNIRSVIYVRCSADEKVPCQYHAWRSAAFVLRPSDTEELTPLLEPQTRVLLAPESFAHAYELEMLPDLSTCRQLTLVTNKTAQALIQSQCLGDDYGNITAFSSGNSAPAHGMNRLNHGVPMFHYAWLTGNTELRNAAVLWCINMYDLSLWWGQDETFGGTRYNNAEAAGQKTPDTQPTFMWRTNTASSFCTKGFAAFLYAFEETGDPRMSVALNAQLDYARKHVHADQGECRNVGIVDDFMKLYQLTGVPDFKNQALRLFGELRTRLSENYLFDQGGKPIEKDLPFIDDDGVGLKHGFAKPYIIGYGLAGLPQLFLQYPEEQDLLNTIKAIATFMTDAQDPLGGWRYPHPRSSTLLLAQAMEHAAQLAKAAQILEKQHIPIDKTLNAIERTLQMRVCSFMRTGNFLYGLKGWEKNPGALPEGKTIYDLYQRPEDRTFERDYAEGEVTEGFAPPEGLVYWYEVLAFYLKHRPPERLLWANPLLESLLARLQDQRPQFSLQEDKNLVNLRFTEFPGLDIQIEPCQLPTEENNEVQQQSGWILTDSGDAYYAQSTKNFRLVISMETLPNFVIGQIDHVPVNDPYSSDVINGSLNIQLKKESPFSLKVLDNTPYPSALLRIGDNTKTILITADRGTIVCPNAYTIHLQMPIIPQKFTPTAAQVEILILSSDTLDEENLPLTTWKNWSSHKSAPTKFVIETQNFGMRAKLPIFTLPRLQDMTFPESFQCRQTAVEEWRRRARDVYLKTLGPQLPAAPFNMAVIATEDRGSYEALKIAWNISTYERIKSYLLVPKAPAQKPGIIALHDHGARFSIGKEKVVRPFDEPPERIADAQEWVNKYYGGRWIGDELAARGYVVLAIDALFWSDRGRAEGHEYEAQQELAANLFQLGMTWAGKIVWDDVRSAEFLQSIPEVSPEQIGCIGLSLGGHRTWSLAAATDIVRAGAAICWLADSASLMSEGNNQTRGQSSFSMIHPGLRNALDYPDVAAIACPKPMLFFNGLQDHLFPVDGVNAAYQKMRYVWQSANADDRLVTKLWDVPHEFSRDMQEEAFAWLDKYLKNTSEPTNL